MADGDAIGFIVASMTLMTTTGFTGELGLLWKLGTTSLAQRHEYEAERMIGRIFTRVFAPRAVWISLVGGWVTLAAASLQADGPANFMMLTRVDGRTLEGQPLEWDDRTMLLLGRDGQLYQFANAAAQKSRKTGPAFQGYSAGEMSERLRTEFGKEFRITTTSHFVVVHPHGEWRAWADRLESLFRSFTHSMQVRGFRVRAPKVPLVAVVFRTQSEYYRYASASGTPLQPGTLGHYDPKSNRILLFNAGHATGDDWSVNAETIIHEATHQTAFNVGVHRRFAEQPRWLVEGLAMMFEARGVWDGRSIYTRSDRINRGRLNDFRYYQPQLSSGAIRVLVESDQLFRTNPGFAYAEAWTLSFFLYETRPQEYSRYLETVAARKAFSEYPAKARLVDFTRSFGNDLKLLDAQLLRFVDELK